jgi:hypothetical protein
VIFTWLIDFSSEPIAKTPKPGFPFRPRKREPSYTYFTCSRHGETIFIRSAPNGLRSVPPPVWKLKALTLVLVRISCSFGQQFLFGVCTH